MKYLIVILLAPFLVFGQDNDIPELRKSRFFELNDTIHDFGTIKQEDGDVGFVFEIINKSKKPISIIDVEAECGCTKPDESKITQGEIAPGDTGQIVIGYLASTHTEEFFKKIRVTTTKDSFDLAIKGYVVPDPKLTYFTEEVGPLLMENSSFQIETIWHSIVEKKSFKVYNPTDSVMTITNKANVPSFVYVNIVGDSIFPKSFGVIEVSYDAEKSGEWGYFTNYINFELNGEEVDVAVRGVVQELFDKNRNRKKDPIIKFSHDVYAYGSAKQHDTLYHNFEFQNVGNSPLVLRKVYATCKCINIELAKTIYDPGEKGVIKVSFNTGARRGKQHKTIIVQANAPDSPINYLKFEGKVRD